MKESESESYKKNRALLKELCIDPDKPYKPSLFAWVGRISGLGLTCLLIIGWPYLNFFHWGIQKTLLSQNGFMDVLGYILAWAMWSGAVWSLWHYIFISKDWKNPP